MTAPAGAASSTVTAAAVMRPCGLVPSYDNPRTVRAVVTALRQWLPDVLVVDDGSGPEGRAAIAALGEAGLARVLHLPRNRGKGAAMKAGFARLLELGFTHAMQVDADGQHDLTQVPVFLAAARAEPTALVLGYPVYDATVPTLRLKARALTRFWVDVEVGGPGRIRDALIGCRVYPVAKTLAVGARGNRMEYEVEIAVRMARAGVPLVNLPVGVRYLTREQGGVSHWRPFGDNVRLSWMHCRICTALSTRWLLSRLGLVRP